MSTQEVASTNTTSKRENLKKFSWKEYLILVAASLLGVIASFPTMWSSIQETVARANIPVLFLLGGQIVQSTIWMLIAVGVGLLLSMKQV